MDHEEPQEKDQTPIEAPPIYPPYQPQDRPLVFGWVGLALVFLLLIFVSTGRYFSQDPKKPDFSATEMALRQTLLMNAAAKEISKQAETTAAKIDPSASIRELLKKVTPKSTASTHAAKLELAMLRELGEKPDEKAIQFLADKGDSQDRSVAKLYSLEKVTTEDARKLSPKTKDNFTDRLIEAQAYQAAGDKSKREELFPPSKAFLIVFAIGAAVVCGLIGVAAFLLGFLLHTSNKWKTDSEHFVPRTDPEADRYGMRALIYFGIFMGLPFFTLMIPGEMRKQYSNTISLVMYILIAALMVLMLRYTLRTPDPLKKIVGKTDKPMRLAGIGAIAFFANIPVLVVLTVVFSVFSRFLPEPSHPSTEVIASNPSLYVMLATIFMGSVLAPFMEETVFRGLIFPGLWRILKSPWTAMLLQAFCFAAIHPQGPLLIPMLGWIGFMGSFLAYKTGSLIPSMTMHAIHNTAIFILAIMTLT